MNQSQESTKHNDKPLDNTQIQDGSELTVMTINKNLDMQLVVVGTQPSSDDIEIRERYNIKISVIDHAWSRRILELIGNKAKLLENFSWLSTIGGGFSALGERDRKFAVRAGALSLGQQLQLAQSLGDERLEVMCHLFAALAALQLENGKMCSNYIKNVITPLMKSLPYRDPVLINMLSHVTHRARMMEKFAFLLSQNAKGQIKEKKEN